MKLEKLIDIKAFIASVNPPDKDIFQIWSSTAIEVSRQGYRDVLRIQTVYMEIPESELQPRHIISFVEQLLEAMQSDEERKTLIRVEAFEFKKFV